jgi:ATPase family protein associated with various cellular activities (AAA)
MVAVMNRFPPSFFGEHVDIAKKLADRRGQVTLAALGAALPKAADDATRAAIQDMILKAQQEVPADAVPASRIADLHTALPTRSMTETEDGLAAEAKAESIAVLDQHVIGQQQAKVFISRVIDAQETGLVDGPKCVAIAGPPGVGKTELSKAVSALVTERGDRPLIVIEGNKITDDASLRRYTGAPPSFVGYVKPDEDKLNPMSRYVAQQKFGDGPIVILLDEVDKIGMGHPRQKDIKAAFWNSFGGFLQDGIFRYENGGEFNFCRTSEGKRRPVYVVITSNAGQDRAGGLERGPALRQHFVKAMQDDIRNSAPHLIRRIANFVAADPLEPKETQAITEKVLREAFAQAKDIARKEDNGKEIELSVTERATELLGILGLSQETGASMLKNIIESLLYSKIGDLARKRSKDEEHWELDISVDPRSPEGIGRIAELKEDFAHASDNLGATVPDKYTPENFPIDFLRKNPKPEFYPYEGEIPHEQGYEMVISSTGRLGRRPFIVSNDGTADSDWKFRLLQAGATEDKDKWIDAPGKMPAELAGADVTLQAVPIDADRLFFYGVSTPDKGDKPVVNGYYYSLEDRAYTKSKAELPALFDTHIGVISGKVVFAGGRKLEKNEFGEWTFDPTKLLTDISGDPLNKQAWILDPENDTCTKLAAGMSVPRAGVTPIENKGKLYYFGGIENRLNSDDIPFSASSTAAESFDPKTLKFSREAALELPTDLGYAATFHDRYGRIQLAGGKTLSDVGRNEELRKTLLRIDLASDNPRWRAQDNVPEAGADIAAIPHPSGRVLGPFFDDDGNSSFQILR